MNNNFETLNETELMEIEGGGIGLILLLLAMGGLGLYNGFNDTMDQKE